MSNFLSQLVIIFILALLNGLFSLSEMAVVSSRRVRLQQRAEDGDERARAVLELAEHPNLFLSTVQVGITLIATLSGAIGGAGMTADVEVLLNRVPFLQRWSHSLSIVLIVLLVTYLSLVIGELVPKRLALSNPEVYAGRAAGMMQVLAKLGRPIVWLLSVSTEGVLRLIRAGKTTDVPVTPEEITGLMEAGQEVGVFEQAETVMVESVFRLGDLHAGSLMTPRTDVDWLDLEEPFAENLRRVVESPHLHFPVAEGDLDNVTGIVRGKDLLVRVRESGGATINGAANTGPASTSAAEAGEAAADTVNLAEMVEPAQFIPESMPALQVLEVLRGASGNLALVIDEYGGMLGLVTLFDVMEAIVGGISVGGEPVTPDAVQREDGSWLVEGMMRIDEFKKLLDLDELPEEERAGYETVGGFIMAHMGAVPEAGQHFEYGGWRFEVMDMDGMRVDKVLAAREPAGGTPADAAAGRAAP